jgi:hypothetical protein
LISLKAWVFRRDFVSHVTWRWQKSPNSELLLMLWYQFSIQYTIFWLPKKVPDNWNLSYCILEFCEK